MLKLKEMWLMQKWGNMHKAYRRTGSLQREKKNNNIWDRFAKFQCVICSLEEDTK